MQSTFERAKEFHRASGDDIADKPCNLSADNLVTHLLRIITQVGMLIEGSIMPEQAAVFTSHLNSLRSAITSVDDDIVRTDASAILLQFEALLALDYEVNCYAVCAGLPMDSGATEMHGNYMRTLDTEPFRADLAKVLGNSLTTL